MGHTDSSTQSWEPARQEYFQEEVHRLIQETPGCANISDNTWLWLKDSQSQLPQAANWSREQWHHNQIP